MKRKIHAINHLIRSSLFFSALAATSTAFSVEKTNSTTETARAWQSVASSLFRDSYDVFAKQSDRESLLGQAVTLLQLQPKTDGNVTKAAAIFDQILAVREDDEVGINARYFRGRIEHVHRSPINLPAAAENYKKLIAAHPAHPLAGQALVKLSLIELYRIQPADDLKRAFARFVSAAGKLNDTATRRDLYLILGDTALRFDLGKALALDQFLAAREAGILRTTLEADTLVRIGEIARELNRTDIARAHYAQFLANFPRDNRRQMIIDALAALPAATASANTATLAP